MTTPQTRMAEGQPARLTTRSRDERQADGWIRNEHLEALLRLRAENPDKYDKVSAALKMSVGYYDTAKKAADPGGAA
ncbi:MAG: hypothetical protein WKF86_07770 [Acidimicrobiales bacterium]